MATPDKGKQGRHCFGPKFVKKSDANHYRGAHLDTATNGTAPLPSPLPAARGEGIGMPELVEMSRCALMGEIYRNASKLARSGERRRIKEFHPPARAEFP